MMKVEEPGQVRVRMGPRESLLLTLAGKGMDMLVVCGPFAHLRVVGAEGF